MKTDSNGNDFVVSLDCFVLWLCKNSENVSNILSSGVSVKFFFFITRIGIVLKSKKTGLYLGSLDNFAGI